MAEEKAEEEYFVTTRKLYGTQVSRSVNESLLKQPHPFVHVAACGCSPVSGCGPRWLAKPEILTVWPLWQMCAGL